jgi:hypothetical protein
LAVQVAPRNPEHLAFSYHLDCFDSLNHCPRRCRRRWPLHSTQPSLDVAMVGFDLIITGSFFALRYSLICPTALTPLSIYLANCFRLANCSCLPFVNAFPHLRLSDCPHFVLGLATGQSIRGERVFFGH